MIIVHHLNNSRSQRVLWLLEERGLQYEIERYERDPMTMLAPASLREVHPLGKSPVINDGGLTLAESGAIIEYLEAEIGKNAWFAGNEFTAADIQMSFPLEAAAMRAGLDASQPKLLGFLARIHARPAYRRALERGGPYELLR
jgi:glutathione S-transferase